MKNLNRITKIVAFICLILCSAGNAGTLSSVEITAQNTSIRAGEPLIVKLTYKFEQPQVLGKTDKVVPDVIHNASFQVIETGTEVHRPINPVHMFPSSLTLQDSQGIKYSDCFVIFYDPHKKKLVFDEPGTYTLAVFGDTKVSNNLSITVVSATSLEKKALSLLTDPGDYFFLELGLYESGDSRGKSMIQLKKIVEQTPATMLARWSAGRLGLEYFKAFHKKNPSFEKFRKKQKESGLEEPLLDEANKYLRIAGKLPDNMPIRAEVLCRHSQVEFAKGNDMKAYSILDELSAVYPNNKFGKRAEKAKLELQKLKENQLKQNEQVEEQVIDSNGKYAVAGIIVIVIFGLIFFVRGKIKKKK